MLKNKQNKKQTLQIQKINLQYQKQNDLNVFQKYHFKRNLQKWKQNNKQLKNTLLHWCKTEKDYTTMLRFINVQLKIIFQNDLGLKPSVHQEIFMHVETLLQIHTQFYQVLKKQLEKIHQPDFKIGAFMKYFFPKLENHIYWVRSLTQRTNKILQLVQKGYEQKYNKIFKKKIQNFKIQYTQQVVTKLTSMRLVNYLQRVFPRNFDYKNYMGQVMGAASNMNSDTINLKEANKILLEEIHVINQKMDLFNKQKVEELSKKYKGIKSANRIFFADFSINYYVDGKLLQGTLYVMNDLLLVVDEKLKQYKRIILSEQTSWFHRLTVGKNFRNVIFVRGCDSKNAPVSQSLFFQTFQDIDSFTSIQINIRKELQASRKKGYGNKAELIVKPQFIRKDSNKIVYFGLFMQLKGQQKGIYNFFSIQQLMILLRYVTQSLSIQMRNLQQITNLPITTLTIAILNDFQCQHVSMCLYEYFQPLLASKYVHEDDQLQFLLKLRDYLALNKQKVKQANVNPLQKLILKAQKRIRLQQIDFGNNDLKQIVVEIGPVQKKIMKIGKQQRVYSIIRRIIRNSVDIQQDDQQQILTIDFTLVISKQGWNRGRLLDDDQILYQYLIRQEYQFQKTGFKNMVSSLLRNDCKIYLVKYLFLEHHIPSVLNNINKERLKYLTLDVLLRLQLREKVMQYSKQVQLLGRMLILIKPQKNQILNNYINYFWIIYSKLSTLIKSQQQKNNYQQSKVNFFWQFYKKIIPEYQKSSKEQEKKFKKDIQNYYLSHINRSQNNQTSDMIQLFRNHILTFINFDYQYCYSVNYFVGQDQQKRTYRLMIYYKYIQLSKLGKKNYVKRFQINQKLKILWTPTYLYIQDDQQRISADKDIPQSPSKNGLQNLKYDHIKTKDGYQLQLGQMVRSVVTTIQRNLYCKQYIV